MCNTRTSNTNIRRYNFKISATKTYFPIYRTHLNEEKATTTKDIIGWYYRPNIVSLWHMIVENVCIPSNAWNREGEVKQH